MDKDLTAEEQAEYEAALAKKAIIGRVFIFALCTVDILLGVCFKTELAYLSVLTLALVLLGTRKSVTGGVIVGGLYAVIGALVMADMPRIENTAWYAPYYKAAAAAMIVWGLFSAVMFFKSGYVAAYFEYRTSNNRKRYFNTKE